jgi:hypothetical protein
VVHFQRVRLFFQNFWRGGRGEKKFSGLKGVKKFFPV